MAHLQRLIGSMRRECLGHVVVLDERHLPDADHRVPHAATVVTCESLNDLLPPLRRLAWAHDPARRSSVGVSPVLGLPFPHCDGLFTTHKGHLGAGVSSADSYAYLLAQLQAEQRNRAPS